MDLPCFGCLFRASRTGKVLCFCDPVSGLPPRYLESAMSICSKPQIKENNQQIPSRSSGECWTSNSGTFYVLFLGGSLYRLNPKTGKVFNLTNTSVGKAILAFKPKYEMIGKVYKRCLPRWLYNRLCATEITVVESDLAGATEESATIEADTSQTTDNIMPAMDKEKPEEIRVDWKKPGPNFVVLVRRRSGVVVCAMNASRSQAWENPNGSVGTGYSDQTLMDKGWRKGNLGEEMFSAVRILLGYEVAEALAA